ncbi:hypothetical protein [Rothia sp. (in: high G+C Gram-positive bacteria)]|uniref:hypothetical protein n=1 Tax=Rothia sp. (in: high G+C Gram-positive bacteria) TaxID=1885016 RepID=UPI000EDE3DE6|nr:hypothetical protein [Rothia sp. (in: high G+C Gram-positive bacteria)]
MLLAEIFHKIYPVFLAGLVFGAGLPILYAVAVRLVSGTATETADGTVKVEVHPLAGVAAYAIFVLLALAILTGILWIAKDFLYAYTGFNLFGVAD